MHDGLLYDPIQGLILFCSVHQVAVPEAKLQVCLKWPVALPLVKLFREEIHCQ